jgi:hypothetical protein
LEEAHRLLEPLAGIPSRQAPSAATRAMAAASRAAEQAADGVGAAWSRAAGAAETAAEGVGAAWSRAAGAALDPTVRRLLLIAGGSLLLALLSFLVAVAVIRDPLGVRPQAAPAAVTAAPTTTGPPPTTIPPPSTVPTTASAPAPPGWSVHTDEATGYQVAVPPGWRIDRDGDHRTELHDESSPTVLRIEWQQDPQADPLATEQQASQGYAEDLDDYQPARLEPAEFKGLPAALLEFTYREDDETWHALELGIRSPRHHVAMTIHARDRDWGQGWALFEVFKQSFVAPPA